ncbi:MAG: hypothetical protein DDT39_00046 [Firmicutes bacterium]|nr:hypothetical protein [candidate division NPL-UPA2 bacterium]
MSITFEALSSAASASGATSYGGDARFFAGGGAAQGSTIYGGSAGVGTVGGSAFMGGETLYDGWAFPNGFARGAHIYDGRMPLSISLQIPGAVDGSYVYEGRAETGGHFRVNPGAEDVASGYLYGGFARSFRAGGFMEGATGYVASFDRPRRVADTAIFTVFTRAFGLAGVTRDVVYEVLRVGLTQGFLESFTVDEQLFFGDTARTRADSSLYAQDDFRLGGRLNALLLLLIDDGLILGSTASARYSAIARAREALLLSGVAVSEADANDALTLAILLGARMDALFREQLAESVVLGDVFEEQYRAVSELVEGVRVTDTTALSAVAVFLAEDRVAIGGSALSSAEFVSRLRDAARLTVRFTVENDEFVAWTINTESKHLTSYSHFPANSLAVFGGRALAALDNGIYALDGDDDAGQPIPAKIRFAMTNLGAGQMKRLDAAYLGFSASGSLLLKVVHTTDAGGKVAHVYRMVPRQQNVVGEGRIKLGLGVQSMYWGFELHNVDGANFALDSIDVRELAMARRVSGSGRRGAP